MVDKTDNTSNEPGWLSKALKVLSLPVSATIGYLFAKAHIHESAFSNMRKDKAFGKLEKRPKSPDNILDKRQHEFEGMLAKHQAERESIVQEGLKLIEEGKNGDISKPLAESRKNFARAADSLMKKLGIRNFFDEWGITGPSAHNRAVMEGLAAAGIALGVIFSIASNKTIQQAFSKRDAEQKSEQGPSV
jgi:hypothetical protein